MAGLFAVASLGAERTRTRRETGIFPLSSWGSHRYRVMGESEGDVLSVLSVRGTGSPSVSLMTGNASETNRWPPVTALVMTASSSPCFFDDTSRCSQGEQPPSAQEVQGSDFIREGNLVGHDGRVEREIEDQVVAIARFGAAVSDGPNAVLAPGFGFGRELMTSSEKQVESRARTALSCFDCSQA